MSIEPGNEADISPPVSQGHISSNPSHVNTARAGRAFLEKHLLLVPAGVTADVNNMASAMFQVSALPGVPGMACQAIRALAFMLEELEESALSAATRDAVTEQMEYMREELRDVTAGIKDSIADEVARQVAAVGIAATSAAAAMGEAASKATADFGVAATKAVSEVTDAAQVRHSSPYRDALMQGAATPSVISTSDSRVEARQAIMARQILLDVPEESPSLRMSAAALKEMFSDALDVVSPTASHFALRVVERQSTRGILCETKSTEAAEWLVKPVNLSAFVAAMGDAMRGAEFCARNFTVVVFNVPVEFDPLDTVQVRRLAEVNGWASEAAIVSL